MNSKKRKRSRAAAEVERAQCLFELRVASLPAARTAKDEKLSRFKRKPIKKKGIPTAAEEAKPLFQPSLFEPTGKFRSNATMDVYYNIEPRNDWSIVRHAKVSQWIEADDDGITDALYWRQAFDYRTSQLSTT